MNISVIIPTMNRSEDLRRCLGALMAQDRPADEVIVIIGPGDTAAMGVFEEVSAGMRGWRSIPAARPSVVEALNLGLAEARGDIIVMTDDDAEAPPVWLQRIEQWFLRDEKIGAVGGRDHLMLPDELWLANPPPAKHVGQFNWYGWLSGNHHCGVLKSPLEVDVLKGVNLSFRRMAFPKVIIDPYLISSGAEVGWEMDICLVIRQSGWKIIYDNDVFVRHHVGQRTAGDDRVEIASPAALRRAQNGSYLLAKHQPMGQTLAVVSRSVAVGSKRQPGLLRGLAGLFMGRIDRISAAWRLALAQAGGVRDGRRERRKHQSFEILPPGPNLRTP